MKIILNDYYVTIINDILQIIKASENGKRVWYLDENQERNYSISTKSTYPDYIQFYFVKTPKEERYLYKKGLRVAWKDGYFNGSPRDLEKMFSNALNGKMPRSKRMLYVFDIIIYHYLIESIDCYNFHELDFIELPF